MSRVSGNGLAGISILFEGNESDTRIATDSWRFFFVFCFIKMFPIH